MAEDAHPDFTEAMLAQYQRANNELSYKSPNFIERLTDYHGHDTATHYVQLPSPTTGFTTLWEKKRLDLAVEALVLRPEWHALFDQVDLLRAYRRLEEFGYDFPADSWSPEREVVHEYPEIAILPMSDGDEEFAGYDIEALQQRYFLDNLPRQYAGEYNYRSKGLNAVSGSLVLFQFNSRIVASAVFLRSEKFDHPKGDYNGTLTFAVDSIRVFSPVEGDVMKSVWPDDFPGFKQVKTRLDPSHLPLFEKQLTGVRLPTLLAETLRDQFDRMVVDLAELSEAELLDRIKNSKAKPRQREATAVVYVRNPDVVAYVLKRAKGTCERCNQPAPFTRRSDKTPYLEVHHAIRLADGGDDTPSNAQALCPNCHREVHYG